VAGTIFFGDLGQAAGALLAGARDTGSQQRRAVLGCGDGTALQGVHGGGMVLLGAGALLGVRVADLPGQPITAQHGGGLQHPVGPARAAARSGRLVEA
jgi:hypothetical protein